MSRHYGTAIAEYRQVTADYFENEIATKYQPALLRGLVEHWPIVAASRCSDQTFIDYLAERYPGGVLNMISAKANAEGKYFYNENFDGFNFTRSKVTFAEFSRKLLERAIDANADTVALQSAIISEHFPGFIEENPSPLFPTAIQPRIWIGNRSTVVTHYDDSANIACAISGRRVFTLFPPEQVSNLYIGPLEFTPAGAAVSLADLKRPDFNRFPRLRDALQHAQTAELSPGDAIYIPPLWWHHVEALDGINGLVNYWQGGSIENQGKLGVPAALYMTLLTLNKLHPHERAAWAAIFNHFAFQQSGDPVAHIPQHVHGILGVHSDALENQLKAWLIEQLKK